MNLSPNMKLSIITITTGKAKSKFSPIKIAGIVNAIDNTSNDRFSDEKISIPFIDFIISKIRTNTFLISVRNKLKVYPALNKLFKFNRLITLFEITIALC